MVLLCLADPKFKQQKSGRASFRCTPAKSLLIAISFYPIIALLNDTVFAVTTHEWIGFHFTSWRDLTRSACRQPPLQNYFSPWDNFYADSCNQEHLFLNFWQNPRIMCAITYTIFFIPKFCT